MDTLKQISYIEWLIFITALVYVWLAAKEKIACWFFGIVSSLFSVVLCYEGQLFLESGLQVFYLFIGVYGWYEWKYGKEGKSELTIISYSIKKLIPLLLIALILWLVFGYIAGKYSTQALPYLDAFITAFSLIATWMTAKKIIENWLFWIVIDGLAIVLYLYRGFYLIGILYIIYTFIAFWGYLEWKRKIKL